MSRCVAGRSSTSVPQEASGSGVASCSSRSRNACSASFARVDVDPGARDAQRWLLGQSCPACRSQQGEPAGSCKPAAAMRVQSDGNVAGLCSGFRSAVWAGAGRRGESVEAQSLTSGPSAACRSSCSAGCYRPLTPQLLLEVAVRCALLALQQIAIQSGDDIKWLAMSCAQRQSGGFIVRVAQR